MPRESHGRKDMVKGGFRSGLDPEQGWQGLWREGAACIKHGHSTAK